MVWQMFSWVRDLYVFDLNRSCCLSASRQIKCVSCCRSYCPTGEKLHFIYLPKPVFTHIWHVMRVHFGSCLSALAHISLFLCLRFLQSVKERRCPAKNMHTYNWNTNQAVDVLAKPKNAVCINLIWAEKSITSCARSITNVCWKNSSGWFGIMRLLSNTLRQAVQDAIIEIFSCSAVFVLFWCASVFCLSFFLVMSYWKYMLTASCYTPVFVGGLCSVWERPKGLSRPLTDLIKSNRPKRGSDWEIERGKTKTWPCLTACEHLREYDFDATKLILLFLGWPFAKL